MPDNRIDIDNTMTIHFVGIGGSGMCPMAQILYNKGYKITGSDTYMSDTLEKLLKLDIKIYTEHNPNNIDGADIVTYSAAIKQDNPELVEARKRGIPTLERSVMLGIVCSKYKLPIAVSGTHGKTTTTSMLTQIMLTAKRDPSAIIGGKLTSINSHSCVGKSDIMICEACEYVDSFLQLNPAVSIILNIDADHLDYFKTFDNIKKSFKQFSSQTTQTLVVNGDDIATMDCIKDTKLQVITFGFNSKNDYYAINITKNNKACDKYDLMFRGNKLCEISLKVPGKHNILNSLAAAATAHTLGIEVEYIQEALSQFIGVHRRFEILGTPNNITIADDFAHHPTELKATLNCAMEMGFNNVWALFQPHTFSRTAMLLDDFAEALSIPDHVIMSQILPVRETNTYNIHTSDLAAKVPNSVYFDTFEEMCDYVIQYAKPGDLILTLGGGNVYRLANMILDKENSK